MVGPPSLGGKPKGAFFYFDRGSMKLSGWIFMILS